MKTAELEIALAAVLDPRSKIRTHAEEVRSRSDLPLDLADDVFERALSHDVSLLLKSEEPFSETHGFLVQTGTGLSGFYAEEGALVLTRRLLAGQSPQQALAWLAKFLATKKADGFGVLVLSGVEVPDAVDLGNGVRLQPFATLPDSRTKTWVAEAMSRWSPLSGPPSWMNPDTAITGDMTIQPLLHPSSDAPNSYGAGATALHTRLRDLRLLLSLLAVAPTTEVGYWFQFVDPDIDDGLVSAVVTTTGTAAFQLQPSIPVRLSQEGLQRASSGFALLKDPLRSRLLLALRRFDEAMRQPAYGDRALDLAISLESLLVDGNAELSYKVALRGSLLLPLSLPERADVRHVLEALYDLRSAIVHDGKQPAKVKVKGRGKVQSPVVVREATLTVASILRAVLENGETPNWCDFELTGGTRR